LTTERNEFSVYTECSEIHEGSEKTSLETDGNEKARMGLLQSGENGTKGPDAYHFGDDVMVK